MTPRSSEGPAASIAYVLLTSTGPSMARTTQIIGAPSGGASSDLSFLRGMVAGLGDCGEPGAHRSGVVQPAGRVAGALAHLDAESAKGLRCADAVFVGAVVADIHRPAAGERRPLHQRAQGAALVHAA